MTRENGDQVPERLEPRGIVIHDRSVESPAKPVIQAFIWGGKTRPVPTLPFGRWKATAA
jgi:hypothetical protein